MGCVLFYKNWKQPTEVSTGFSFRVDKPAFLLSAPWAKPGKQRSPRSDTQRQRMARGHALEGQHGKTVACSLHLHPIF